MTIEFNGRAVASFALGLIVGGIGMGVSLALGPIGRVQAERDDSKQKLAEMTAERDRLLGVSQQMFRRINELTPQSAAPQDPAVQVLNAVRPGLGTAAGALATAAQKAQIAKAQIQCPVGSTPQTSPNWQGVRCVDTGKN